MDKNNFYKLYLVGLTVIKEGLESYEDATEKPPGINLALL
jgi:hypothetical protein